MLVKHTLLRHHLLVRYMVGMVLWSHRRAALTPRVVPRQHRPPRDDTMYVITRSWLRRSATLYFVLNFPLIYFDRVIRRFC